MLKALRESRPFAWALLLFQLFLVIIFFVGTDYEEKPRDPRNNEPSNESPDAGKDSIIANWYWYFNHIVMMMPIGFGYLVTFLRKYRYSGIGFTFLLTALIFQWSLIIVTFWRKVKNGDWSPFKWSLELFILGMYSVGSHLITLGGIIGKVNIEQLMVLMIPQTVFYGLNWYVCQLVLKATDIGGSLIIHVFGCYYGLAATIWLSRKPMKSLQEAHESGYTSDTFSMIGTIFLWMMWPSFNAATALPHLQYRAVINTVLSLCSATVTTFGWSNVLRGKLLMEDVQNATLAGGVAVGAVADLYIYPGGAIIIGFFAATVSVFGFRFLNPWLASKGIYDTCGINNLHGMPGLIGGLSSVVATGIANKGTYGVHDYAELFPKGGAQFGIQFAAIFITLAISIASGTLFGFIASLIPSVKPPFHDHESWEVPHSHHLEAEDGAPLSEYSSGR